METDTVAVVCPVVMTATLFAEIQSESHFLLMTVAAAPATVDSLKGIERRTVLLAAGSVTDGSIHFFPPVRFDRLVGFNPLASPLDATFAYRTMNRAPRQTGALFLCPPFPMLISTQLPLARKSDLTRLR